MKKEELEDFVGELQSSEEDVVVQPTTDDVIDLVEEETMGVNDERVIDFKDLSKTKQKQVMRAVRKEQFKQNREKEKIRKISKKVNKMLKDVDGSEGPAQWIEGQRLALTVHETLLKFTEISNDGRDFVLKYQSQISEVLFNRVTKLAAIVVKDCNECLGEWIGISKLLGERTDTVHEDDIAEYMDIYTGLIALQQKIINVISNNVTRITEDVFSVAHLEKETPTVMKEEETVNE